VLDPRADQFGYRDLVAAREVRRLLDLGLALAQIVEAAVTLRRSGRRLSDTRLGEAPWGEVVQEVAGRLGRLNGQYTLPLEEGFETVDEVFQRAEEAELQGNLASAARDYGTALRMDPADPVIPFNLGNVLDAAGEAAEAAVSYQRAIAADPTFADAWLNLAVLHEQKGALVKAEACYEGALDARPDYADALYNLALLLTHQERFADAVPLWERYIAVRPKPADTAKALRVLKLCRIAGRVSSGEANLAGTRV
jgi:tetratricopeptide (TPR) repeat protein